MMIRGRHIVLATHQLTGHAGIELNLVRWLVRRGHRITVYAPAELADAVEKAGAELVPFEQFETWEPPSDIPVTTMIEEAAGHAGSPTLAEEFRDVLVRDRPDAALVDVALSGAFVGAEAAGVATAAVMPILYTPWAVWYGRLFADVGAAREALGLPVVESPPDAISRHVRLVLVLSARLFDFPFPRKLERRVRYTGRMVEPDPAAWDDPWPADDRRPLVLVTISSLYRFQDDRIHQILDLLAEMPVRVLVTVGPALDRDAFRAPSNAIVVSWAPHESVVPKAALVVTHGGHNTVLGALSHGVPVLVTPLIPEQVWNGQRAEAFGAGRTLGPENGIDDVRWALDELLFDPRRRAEARAASSAVGDDGRGGPRAAAQVERLCRRRFVFF
jgi:UDP:flavonoid glycosyltransferase YjiC (YdhE family)